MISAEVTSTSLVANTEDGNSGSRPDLSVVIVSHNTREELRCCLEALGTGNGEVVVADSGSSDGSAEFASSVSEVRVLALNNVGFGAAANAGIAASTGRYLLLLNADARPVPGAVQRITEIAASRPDAGAIGPLLRRPDGSVQRSVFANPRGAVSLALWAAAPALISGAYRGLQLFTSIRRCRGRNAMALGTREVVGSEYVQGSAMLLRREAVMAIGGFDERFFMYGEEADLCLRLRQAGWSVLFAPDAEFVHVGEASSRQYADEMYQALMRSHLLVLAKHRGRAVAQRARRLVALAMRLRATVHRGASGRRFAATAAALAEDGQSGSIFDPDSVLSLVGLLHPSGQAEHRVVAGSVPAGRDHDVELDLILLTPSTAQWRDPRWRAHALRQIDRVDAPDGVVFAIAPSRRQRGSMLAALRQSGLTRLEKVAVLPNAQRMRHLFPLAPAAVEQELRHVVSLAPAVARTLARIGCASRLLELVLPTVGFAAQRPGAAPLAGWLGPTDTARAGTWVMSANWRTAGGPAIVLRLDRDTAKVRKVAKVTNRGTGEAEVRALRETAAGAALLGVRTPELVATCRLGDRLALVEEPLEGQRAARWLARHPERIEELSARLVRWLEEWAMNSRQEVDFEWSELERLVLAPARELAPMIANGHSYLDWLVELGSRVVGTSFARTAAHHDLTMWNVLVAPSGELGVLDWAESKPLSFPLGDLAYSLVDAVAAVNRYRSRPDAFTNCFGHGGSEADADRPMAHLATRLRLSREAQAVSFHACWLGHAANELHGSSGQPGPFVAIVSRLAAEAVRIGPGTEGL
jgi:GT2 family glycosyltransferase